MQVAIYCRVSTNHQDYENQLNDLKALCKRSNWRIYKIYSEKVSGKEVDRKELNAMLNDACKRQFEKIVVWSVDRLGRSMKHLINVLEEIDNLGISIFSYKQSIDTSTTMGKMFFQFVGIFSEFENNLRKERIALGIQEARKKGKKWGRSTVITDEMIEKIKELRKQKLGMIKIGKELSVGTCVVQKVVANYGL
jgi:DNA invertase Pin-like site-specific DNA recombinase